jgi:hypothetical protein
LNSPKPSVGFPEIQRCSKEIFTELLAQQLGAELRSPMGEERGCPNLLKIVIPDQTWVKQRFGEATPNQRPGETPGWNTQLNRPPEN